MKHQNVIDKTRSYNKNKARKSKNLYTKNHSHVIADASAALPAAPPAPVIEEAVEESRVERAASSVRKLASGVSKNKIARAGIAAAVGVAIAATLIRQAKGKPAKKVTGGSATAKLTAKKKIVKKKVVKKTGRA